MTDQEELLEHFKQAMRDLYEEGYNVTGKYNHNFRYLMNLYGELEAARRMLDTNDYLANFIQLAYEQHHPELTVEYLIWNSPAYGYRSLFDPVLVENAGRRLEAIA